MKKVSSIFAFLTVPLFTSSPAHGEDKLVIAYNARPPYLVANPDGSATGLTATPVANALKAAGIPFSWQSNPTNRQLQTIRDGGSQYCAIGWFKNPEREKFAKFSKAIYRDKPTVAIARLGFIARDSDRLSDVLGRNNIKVLIKEKYSYGSYIDNLFTMLKTPLLLTTSENSSMVKMINAGRADFMFASEEEAKYFVEQAGYSLKDFQLFRFRDMPEGERRYLMCSKDVSDELISRFNKAVTFE